MPFDMDEKKQLYRARIPIEEYSPSEKTGF
jgi:hypothetical protein